MSEQGERKLDYRNPVSDASSSPIPWLVGLCVAQIGVNIVLVIVALQPSSNLWPTRVILGFTLLPFLVMLCVGMWYALATSTKFSVFTLVIVMITEIAIIFANALLLSSVAAGV
jgi:hypothetical protein